MSSTYEDPTVYRHGGEYVVTEDIEDIYQRWDDMAGPQEQRDQIEEFAMRLLKAKPTTEKELTQAQSAVRKQLKITPRRSQLLHMLPRIGTAEAEAVEDKPALERLRKLLVKKAAKSQSGVLVITVLTSPYPTVAGGKAQKFSCAWNCYYCPNEPGQPRSYLHDEPAVKRANENGFDPVLQFTDRAATLASNGHPIDKVELLVLGGTWASYPHAYQEEFCRDLFFAANTFGERSEMRRRERLSLYEEQTINESAPCKIIGLTLETRPDTIDAEELRRLRYYGCTRVQLGVQHTDDAVLKKINRGCYTRHTVAALRRLKDACFKVDVHLMPNLPSTTVESDRQMFARMLHEGDLQADQWKIYPCEVVPWTVIKKWHASGAYEPYGEDALAELLVEIKQQVHPWIRLNRVVRDIPSQYVTGGVDAPNLRQNVLNVLASRGQRCRCIRCREVGDDNKAAASAELIRREYAGSHGQEVFLAFESGPKETLLGFLRLRFPPTASGGQSSGLLPSLPSLPWTRRRSTGTGAGSKTAVHGPRYIALPTPTNFPPGKLVPPCSTSGTMCDARADGNYKYEAASTEAAAARAKAKADSMDRVDADSEAASAAAAIPFPELEGAALIRELHVYGQLVPTMASEAATDEERLRRRGKRQSQHVGFGRRLMEEAESMAARRGYTKLAVIAGIGARNYYRKLGYEVEGDGGFMLKHIPITHPQRLLRFGARLLLLCVALAVGMFAACHAVSWLLLATDATAVAAAAPYSPPRSTLLGRPTRAHGEASSALEASGALPPVLAASLHVVASWCATVYASSCPAAGAAGGAATRRKKTGAGFRSALAWVKRRVSPAPSGSAPRV